MKQTQTLTVSSSKGSQGNAMYSSVFKKTIHTKATEVEVLGDDMMKRLLIKLNRKTDKTACDRFDHFGNEVTIDSDFDSGNLGKAVKTHPYQFSLWTATDCEGTDREGYPKSWFYFSVLGFQNSRATFNIHRIHVLWALLKTPEKYRPVYRVNGGQWFRLQNDIKSLFINSDGELVLSFDYLFQNRTDKVEFAYTYPYTYEDCQRDCLLFKEKYEGCSDIFFRHHQLAKTVQGRNIDMLMISSHEGKEGVEGPIDPHILQDDKVTRFRISKPIVIITARVHPLETPSSLCMNGIIEFLMNTTDARAYFLRKYFVFLLVPMLNPDGVARGHCRMDTLNQNLNRYYKNPTIESQPSCYAIRKLVEHYNKDKRIFFYLDLHAHPANKGNFVFGNAIFDFVLQVESTLFPKLLSHNCINFQFDQCNFSRKHMKAKDRFEDMNKEGCGRVVLYKEFGVIHAYTLQCGYHSNTNDNQLTEHADAGKIYRLKSKRSVNDEKIYESETITQERQEGGEYVGLDYDAMDDASSEYYKSPTPMYTQKTFNNLGKNILVSILDIWGRNPYPRVADPNELRKDIANNNRKLDRFKKQQSHLKTKEKNIVQLIQQQYYGLWLKRNIFSRQVRMPPQLGQRYTKIYSLRKKEETDISKEAINRQNVQSKDPLSNKQLEPAVIKEEPVKEVTVRQVRLSLLRNTQVGTITQRRQVNIRLLTRKL